jgi:myo-inositol 2-dehydrogenase/D-chiro-inositol 1-dehydrogenase
MTDIRVGIIGTGIMGSGHANYLTKNVSGATVTALADADIPKVQKLAGELGRQVSSFGSAEAFFTEGEFDAVIISSPDNLHVAHLRLAMQRGIPTLCEKPIAPSIQEARVISSEISHFENELGRKLIHFGFMRRFDPSYLEVRRLIETGDYGLPLFVRCSTRNVESVGVTTEGLLSNIAVHEFDILRWLFQSDWQSISVQFPRTSSLSPKGLSDPVMFTGRLNNGILVSADVVANNNYGYDVRTEVVCERGSIEIGIHGDVITRANRVSGILRGGKMDENWIPKFTPAYISELDAWIRGIATGEIHPDLATTEDALIAAEAVELALSALRV